MLDSEGAKVLETGYGYDCNNWGCRRLALTPDLRCPGPAYSELMDTSHCTLPRNTLVDIDRAVWLNRNFSFYLLYKNGHIFAVQGPKSTEIKSKYNRGDPVLQDLHLRKILDIQLELLETVSIERHKWLYLFENDKKEFRLVPNHKSHTLYKIKTRLWLRTVQEGELQLLRWIGWGRSVCLLNGEQREVDIAWDTETFSRMESTMKLLKIYSELDVCFKPVAHVLRGDDIIGIASEKRAGRAIRYSDKRLFYETIARIIACRIIPRGPHRSYYQIHNGKLRITNNFHVTKIWEGPRTEEESKQEEFLWEMIGEMFEQLKTETEATYDSYELADPPFLMRYQCWHSEYPQRNPSMIDNARFALSRGWEVSHISRHYIGVIRTNRLLLPEDQSTEDDGTLINKPPEGRQLVISLHTRKRHCPYFPEARKAPRLYELPLLGDKGSVETITGR
ncbi:hypothetical protein L218DRAFT_945553 [Marasmius fiardii PR-910]|nr:hypothetical protein L218DRAFT_945553 [Marasmius fiardii PR-910]